MRSQFQLNPSIKTWNPIISVKSIIFGLLTAESWHFSKIVGTKLNRYITTNGYTLEALIFCVFGLVLVIIYLFIRSFVSTIYKILRSRRLDIFFAFLAGILVSLAFNGIGSTLYTDIVNIFSDGQLIILLVLPIIVGFAMLLRILQLYLFNKHKRNATYFVSDVEEKSKKDDLLCFSDRAERFAERIFNYGSPESMVFGIDAPWGIGKSSFVNLCKEYWENEYRDDVIIYSFNPLKYEDRENLLEKFVDGLIKIIQKNSFTPEIKPLFSKYSRLIKGIKGSFSILGFEVLKGTYTIDDAFEDLELALSNFDKKIIVVVDDLDRLDFSTIKDILFAIKKSFTLPNISYVLCYDTENISVLEKKGAVTEKVTEFLEKFVNVKVSLYLDSVTLSNYVSINLSKVLDGNSQADPVLVSKAIGGLIEIYRYKDYHSYLPFVGDIRKLKRLINTLLLLEIEKTDFENSDINSQDLIHLLLIYINYPNVFRKIYDTETQGKRGFFSAVGPHDDGYPKGDQNMTNGSRERTVKNSIGYSEYIGSLSENKKFLLNKIFDVSKRLEKTNFSSIPQVVKHSYACFNGGWFEGNNLEQYLNLIVKQSKPLKNDQYRFYLNCKNEIVKGKSIEEVLAEDEFSYSKSENSHKQFWKVIINSAHEFDGKTGSKFIMYLLENIPGYSLFNYKGLGLGLRDDLAYFLIKLLDTAAWTDQNGKHRNNTEDNISEIAEWVFGEKRHVDRSIVDILGKEEKGVLGFYDLLLFRLFCSADQGGDIFNLTRAISKHGDVNAPISGPVETIAIEEMREISQKVFKIFKNQYISKKRNIFELIDNLSLADLAGKYHSFVLSKIYSGEIENVEYIVEALKSRIKAFITFQLGNSQVNSGVGCGYYDLTGKEDEKGIRSAFNDYLFDTCFNPAINQKNYKYFLCYLLINFATTFDLDGHKFIPSINEITKVLDPDKLSKYWQSNSEAIKSLNFDAQDQVVITVNYAASFKDDLANTYEVLDNLVAKGIE